MWSLSAALKSDPVSVNYCLEYFRNTVLSILLEGKSDVLFLIFFDKNKLSKPPLFLTYPDIAYIVIYITASIEVQCLVSAESDVDGG